MKRFLRLALPVIAGLALVCATGAPASADFTTNGFPDIPPSDVGPEGPGANPLGPEFIITISAKGTASVALNPVYGGVDPGPYESQDDTYYGVVNNYAGVVTSISISSTNDIFGFDGDGIQTYLTTAQLPTAERTDPNGYGGAYVTYTINPTVGGVESGTVNFGNGGIEGNGGTDYFSLEEATGLTGVALGSVTLATPEPASLIMAASGALTVFGYGWRRRKAALKK
jgi:hypothetical protein